MRKRVGLLIIGAVILTALNAYATSKVIDGPWSPEEGLQKYHEATGNLIYHRGDANPFEKAGYIGQCTWFVYAVRSDDQVTMGPSGHNNACFWPENYQKDSFAFGSQPKVGAIACWDKEVAGSGHVAFVTKVNSDGSFEVWDCNWSSDLDHQVRHRWVSADDSHLAGFIYWKNSENPPGKNPTAGSSTPGYDDWCPRPVSAYPADSGASVDEAFLGMGKKIVFLSNRSGTVALYEGDTQTLEAHKVIEMKGFLETFAPAEGIGRIILLDSTGRVYLLEKDKSGNYQTNDIKLTVLLKFAPSWINADSFYFASNGGIKKGELVIEKQDPLDEVAKVDRSFANQLRNLAGQLGQKTAKMVRRVQVSEINGNPEFLTSVQDSGGHWQLAMIDKSMRVTRYLTSGKYNNATPNTTKTGMLSMIGASFPTAFVSDRQGNWDIYLANLPSNQPASQFTSSKANETEPAWAFYGQKVLFVTDQSGHRRIWIKDTDGKNAHELVFK
jgi:surface antigen